MSANRHKYRFLIAILLIAIKTILLVYRRLLTIENRPPASFVITLPKLTAHMVVLSEEEQKQEVLRLITDKGDLSRKDIESSLSLTKQLALKLINELLEERKIKKSGMARSVRYFIR